MVAEYGTISRSHAAAGSFLIVDLLYPSSGVSTGLRVCRPLQSLGLFELDGALKYQGNDMLPFHGIHIQSDDANVKP